MYYEIALWKFNLDFLRIIGEKYINIESVYIDKGTFKIVIEESYLDDVCDILKNLNENFCAKIVYLIDFRAEPGALYNILANNNITNLYVAENNRFVVAID